MRLVRSRGGGRDSCLNASLGECLQKNGSAEAGLGKERSRAKDVGSAGDRFQPDPMGHQQHTRYRSPFKS